MLTPRSPRALSDTAITRARVKCVFYDRNDEKRRPMFHYLLARGRDLGLGAALGLEALGLAALLRGRRGARRRRRGARRRR